jgi:hypothetical protein
MARPRTTQHSTRDRLAHVRTSHAVRDQTDDDQHPTGHHQPRTTLFDHRMSTRPERSFPEVLARRRGARTPSHGPPLTTLPTGVVSKSDARNVLSSADCPRQPCRRSLNVPNGDNVVALLGEAAPASPNSRTRPQPSTAPADRSCGGSSRWPDGALTYTVHIETRTRPSVAPISGRRLGLVRGSGPW